MPKNEKKKADKPTDTEKILDKSLEDSFPASDPSSVTREPADKRETKEPPPDKLAKHKR
ncbi:hypothetical protein ACFFJ7_15950 [Pseudochelatococcus lubricantis]|uniref:hypothetical protein n=1 Tax=Pseudochelatococcus lubricantis TaxID=1538102 RepID=UPI0035E86C5C